ncbi:MAG: hypothetical protein KF691_10820 [Phycisphaeraceae bacterium]|nr:hypothetical protein [Phycisphaeraceae bacterium]
MSDAPQQAGKQAQTGPIAEAEVVHHISNPLVRAVAHWYARRIVNVNINIIAAGFLALVPVSICVHFIHSTKFIENAKAIAAITFVLDVVFDFSIYFCLHYLANHGPFRKFVSHNPAYRGMSFLHDAGLVQMQRAILSPMLYIIWLWVQHYLIAESSIGAGWATAIGGVIGIGTSRIVHTIWMLVEERRRHAKYVAKQSARV